MRRFHVWLRIPNSWRDTMKSFQEELLSYATKLERKPSVEVLFARQLR